jgi:hypothetical protein
MSEAGCVLPPLKMWARSAVDVHDIYPGCRALLTQRFLQDIEEDKQKRAQKIRDLLKATEGTNKKLSKEEANAFFARLQIDGERRKKSRYVSGFVFGLPFIPCPDTDMAPPPPPPTHRELQTENRACRSKDMPLDMFHMEKLVCLRVNFRKWQAIFPIHLRFCPQILGN